MIEFKDHCTATLLTVDGDEQRVCESARVSTGRGWHYPAADRTPGDLAKDQGLLRSLVRERHGSPFESCDMRWHIEAPIVVAREAVRHRLSNWNEESGRYVELKPVFYVPNSDRPLMQTGKKMAYHLELGDVSMHPLVETDFKYVAVAAWEAYQQMLDAGIAREVARMVLPVNIMTRWVWKMNVRALTNFLSLRVRHQDSHIESKPMLEIQMLAQAMELDFCDHFPTVWEQWNDSGRLPL